MAKAVNPNLTAQQTLLNDSASPPPANASAFDDFSAKFLQSLGGAGSADVNAALGTGSATGADDAGSVNADGDSDSDTTQSTDGGFGASGEAAGQAGNLATGYSSGAGQADQVGLTVDPLDGSNANSLASFLSKPANQAAANNTIWAAANNNNELANENFTKMLGMMGPDLSGMSIEALIQYVLRESYRGATEDMRMAAKKVQFQNNVKKAIRTEYSRALEGQAKVGNDGKLTTPFIAKPVAENRFLGNAEVVTDANAVAKVSADANAGVDTSQWGAAQQGGGRSTTDANALGAYAEKLKNDLQSVDDDTQLAQQDLQTLVQRMTEMMQNLTQISKDFHDTKMKIIGNI